MENCTLSLFLKSGDGYIYGVLVLIKERSGELYSLNICLLPVLFSSIAAVLLAS